MHYNWKCGENQKGLNRRNFLKVGSAGVFGYALTCFMTPPEILAEEGPPVRGTARNLVFINLLGGPSHVDTFDVKSNSEADIWIRNDRAEELMSIDTFGGINLPGYIFRNLKEHTNKMVVVRSHWGWSADHGRAEYWVYTGQDFNPAFAAERPSLGAVVAFETWKQRQSSDVLPGFVLLNSGIPYTNGFLSGRFAPFNVSTSPNGPGNVLVHPEGEARFNARWDLLQGLESNLRGSDSPLGKPASDFARFYETTKAMMYNQDVQRTFRYTTGQGSEAQRYAPIRVQSDGVTPVTDPGAGANPNGESFGNACLVARNLLKANKGTRAIWINLGGWDQHERIYGSGDPDPNQSIYMLGRRLDAGVGNLVADLRKERGVRAPTLLDETLIVLLGDFGRTPPNKYMNTQDDPNKRGTNNGKGRDHWPQAMTCVFIGGGIRGGRVIGQTDQYGDKIPRDQIGWDPPPDRPELPGPYPQAGPYIRTEDIYYTIYSALGINPRTSIRDTPSRREYKYVGQDFFGEVPLWQS